ncbi:thioesterase family protein [Paraburkholderia sp. CNPSo 3281]|uniref:acyl-CoA thioesterase n=1 Tax=Paraburkholderia sp. CNPSo 3281 TaxID=2940933 RepID=UPI0020B8546A|nr:thioesterase family protein [Paraburkholderia sp. CNPSo 3281]MCP3716663.1 acyl-CoA thioesterase [Paraburkholderia sp. CNPSo 3281]
MATPIYRRKHKIHFSECDPAGIVFYPQYFVLFNDLVESWIDELLPQEGYHGVIGARRVGMPTVRLEVDFKAVSKMGDEVWLSLDVERLGGASLTLAWACTGVDGVLRMAARQTIVTTSLDTHKSIGIPEDIRDAIARAMTAAAHD